MMTLLKWFKFFLWYFPLVMISVIPVACGDPSQAKLPPDAMTIWKTDAANYQNCFIEIDEKMLTIGTSDKRIDVYYIKGIQYQILSNVEMFTLECQTIDENEYTFVLYLEPDGDGKKLTLKNQDHVVWKKASEFGKKRFN